MWSRSRGTNEKAIQQHLAMKAMAVGGLLIASNSEAQDENMAWIGAQLMAVGWRSLYKEYPMRQRSVRPRGSALVEMEMKKDNMKSDRF